MFLDLNPISHGAILKYFGYSSLFVTLYDIDLKSKVVSGYDWIPKIFLDLNPISHGAILPYFGHLTLFVTVQVRSSMTLTSRAKLFGLMVRPWI